MDPMDFKSLQLDDQLDLPELKEEPLLTETRKRFVLFPIQYNNIWEHYKHLEARFWTAEDIELSDDVEGFETLEGKARANIVQLVSYLLVTQQNITTKLTFRFSNEIQSSEARCFFGFQQMQENIHLEVFGLLTEILTQRQEEYRNDTIEMVSAMDCVSQKMAWVERHLVDNNDSFAKRIVSYMIYLSVFDNAIWGLIFYLFDRQIMPGLVHAAAKIKYDRASFVNLLNVIRGHLVNPVEKSAIHEVLAQAVKIEMEMLSEFKELALGKLDLGRNVDFDLLNQKILFDANRTCSMLNVSALFSVTKNPMVWIDGAYEKEHNRYEENKAVKVVKNTPVKNKEQLAFSLDADF